MILCRKKGAYLSDQQARRRTFNKGVVVEWERIRRTNHWLDALGYACAAANFTGVRLIDEAQPSDSSKPLPPRRDDSYRGRFQRPGGEPWIDSQGWREMTRRYLGWCQIDTLLESHRTISGCLELHPG
jgi:hypothetical protein